MFPLLLRFTFPVPGVDFPSHGLQGLKGKDLTTSGELVLDPVGKSGVIPMPERVLVPEGLGCVAVMCLLAS